MTKRVVDLSAAELSAFGADAAREAASESRALGLTLRVADETVREERSALGADSPAPGSPKGKAKNSRLLKRA